MGWFAVSVRRAAGPGRIVCAGLLSAALFAALAAPRAAAQDAAPANPAPAPQTTPDPRDIPPPQTQAEPKRVQQTVDLNDLLADPLAKRADLRQLVSARVALAHQAGDLNAFIATAESFAKQGAYYPAISMLWFAEKMTNDIDQRREFGAKMIEWMGKTEEAEKRLDMVGQLFAAKRVSEAIAEVNRIRAQYPLNEKAAYQTAQLYFNLYSGHDVATQGELELKDRLRLFRAMYEQYCYTVAIDPLYAEGYDGLSRSREVLSDSPGFVQRSEPLSQQAYDFKSLVVPMIASLDEGDRTTGTLIRAADGLAETGLYSYAVYLYTAALKQPSIGAAAPAIQVKIKKILEQDIPIGTIPSPALPHGGKSKGEGGQNLPPESNPAPAAAPAPEQPAAAAPAQ